MLQGVVFDLDNTLYDFVSCYVMALEDAYPRGFAIGAPHSELYSSLCRHFRWSDTVEGWPKRLPEYGRSDWTKLKERFAASLYQNLRLYPGIPDLLHQLRQSRVSINAATNAPVDAAIARLRRLGCLEYFDCVAGWSGGRARQSAHILWSRGETGDPSPSNVMVLRVGGTQRKPSGFMYKEISHQANLEPRSIVVVGDSIDRDLAPAHHLGFEVAWAKYGTKIDEGHKQLLDSLTPWLRSRQAEISFAFPFKNLENPLDLLEYFQFDQGVRCD